MTAQVIDLFTRRPPDARPDRDMLERVIRAPEQAPRWIPLPGDRVIVSIPTFDGEPNVDWPGRVVSGPDKRGVYLVAIDAFGRREVPATADEMRPEPVGPRAA